MDYEIDTTGSEDDVIAREGERAGARFWADGCTWVAAVGPLVRVILALLAALGARSVREALERAASVNNPVRQALDEDDRATAERWARHVYAGQDPQRLASWKAMPARVREEQIAAMLPLVREMREAVAAAHAEQSSAMAHVVGQIASLFGLGKDEPFARVIEVARALTAPVDVEEKVRAEGVAALRRWDEALITMPSYTGDGDERQMAVVVRPFVEREARLVAALRAKAAAHLTLSRVAQQAHVSPSASRAFDRLYLDLLGKDPDEATQDETDTAKSLALLALDRDMLGRVVRDVWVAWAREQPNPKPSWLVEWDDLSEPDKEVDRRIGEALAGIGARQARPAPLTGQSLDGIEVSAWPLRDVLAKLAEGADRLLDGLDHDGDGWERIDAARKVARAHLALWPAPLTEDEAHAWGARVIGDGSVGIRALAVFVGDALMSLQRGDIPPEVRPAGDPHEHAPDDEAPDSVDLCPECMQPVAEAPDTGKVGRVVCGPCRRAAEAADEAPGSVDPRDLPPDSEDPAPVERQCVAVLVTDPADRVLLVRTKRGWELPGGGVEDGEDPRAAARREVREEAGLHVSLKGHEWIELRGTPKPGATYTSRILVFRGRAEGEPQPGSDATRARWWTANEVQIVDRDDPTRLSDLASREVLVDWAHLPARREQVEASRAELPTTRLYREIREADVAAAEARLRFLEGA